MAHAGLLPERRAGARPAIPLQPHSPRQRWSLTAAGCLPGGGKVCVCHTRAIVHESVKQKLVDRLAAEVRPLSKAPARSLIIAAANELNCNLLHMTTRATKLTAANWNADGTHPPEGP